MSTGAAVAGIVGAGVSIAGGVSANSDAKKTAKKQKRLGEANAKYILEEAEVEAKNMERNSRLQMGQANADLGSAGIQLKEGESASNYLKQLEAANQESIDWVRKGAESRAALARKGAAFSANNTRAQGQASMINGIAGGISGVQSSFASGAWG